VEVSVAIPAGTPYMREDAMNQAVHRFKAEFFKALGHPLRLVILEQLSEGEKSVNELQTALGIDQSSTSQQLAVLRNRNIVETRKDGTTVYYRARDPQIFELLEVAKRIFNNHLIDTQSMLEQLNEAVER
jgi:DNA-binding transcriptional ArsR family regulator